MSEERGEFSQGQEQNGPSESRKSAFSRFRGIFQRQQTTPNLAGLPFVREPASVVLARTTLPDRQVALDDISIYSVFPMDSGATRRLALAVNEIRATPINSYDLAQLKPPTAVYDAIPWAASAIAHHYNPEIPVILPSEEEVTTMKPWLNDISRFLGRFSARWQYRFGRFIEKKAENAIEEAARNILSRVDTIGRIDRPRTKFVPELTQLYQEVTRPEYRYDDSLDLGDMFDSMFNFDHKPKQVRIPIEEKVADLVANLRYAKYGDHGRINSGNYPLIASATRISGFPPDSLDEDSAGVVGSEIMSGVETFLKRQNVSGISSAPKPAKTFDFFDANTWNDGSVKRSFAETFFLEQVQTVRNSLPSILTEVQNLLPESGPEIVERVKKLSVDILILSQQGVSNAEIATALFSKPPARR